MKRLTPSLVALALVAGANVASAQPTPATPAPAPDSTDATAHFQRALELYQEQDYAGALVEFRRTHDLQPSYKLYFNIGQVCYQLTDYACALKSFEDYLKEGGEAVSSERRAEVDKELAKLRLRVGRVEIVTNIPGVEIFVDDVAVGKTPLPSSIIMGTGKRHITGTREGYAPVSRIIEVAGTDSMRTVLTFSNGTPGTATSAAEYEPRWNTISWIGLGATAAFGVASAVTGAVALKASNDLGDQNYADGVGPSDKMRSAQDRTRAFALASDITLGLGVASLAATLVYTFVHKPKLRERPAPAAPKAASRGLELGLVGLGAGLRGSF